MNANGLNNEDVSSAQSDARSAKNDSAKSDSAKKDSAKNDLKSDVISSAKKIKHAGQNVRDEIMHGVDIKKVLDAGKSLGETLQTQIETQPYAALGVAAVAGFGLGCVLGSKIGRMALGIGATMVARKILSEVDFRALANKALAD